jgi:hypothetical protein
VLIIKHQNSISQKARGPFSLHYAPQSDQGEDFKLDHMWCARHIVDDSNDGSKSSRFNLNDNYRSASPDNVDPTCPIGRNRTRVQHNGKVSTTSNIESPVMEKNMLN